MRRRVTVLGVCVCLCVCLSVRHHESCRYAQLSVQPKVPVPTASAQSGKQIWRFRKLWREKANKYVLTGHHMTPMERHFARNFEDRAFSGSFKV